MCCRLSARLTTANGRWLGRNGIFECSSTTRRADWGEWRAPTREHIEFARDWDGRETLLAALNREDIRSIMLRIMSAKAYYRPHAGMLRLTDVPLVEGPVMVVPTAEEGVGSAAYHIEYRPEHS